MRFKGYGRKTGRPGIRNRLLVLYTVNCAAHVADCIAREVNKDKHTADLLGYESCFDNQTVIDRMLALINHPNTGAVLLVGHGCEFIRADRLAQYARTIGKPVDVVMDQTLGTRKAIERGVSLSRSLIERMNESPRVDADVSSLMIGVLASGAVDDRSASAARSLQARLLDSGAGIVCSALDCSFPGTTAQTRSLNDKIDRFYQITRASRPEKAPIDRMPEGVLRIGDIAERPGLWLLDVLQDAQMEKGLAASDPMSRAMDLVCSGVQAIAYASAGCAVCGTALSPVFIIGDDNRNMEADCACDDDLWTGLNGIVNGTPTVSETLGMYAGVLYAS